MDVHYQEKLNLYLPRRFSKKGLKATESYFRNQVKGCLFMLLAERKASHVIRAGVRNKLC